MRQLNQLVLVGAVALTALALTASSASAALTVAPEPGFNCGAVTPIGAHGTEGGCHFEAEGEISFWVHPPALPAETATGVNCLIHIEGFIGETGTGFITNQVMTSEPTFPCNRQACDEAETAESAHVEHRWPLTISEVSPGDERATTILCIRPGSPTEQPSAEGGAQTQCAITFRILQTAHQQEIGRADNSHQFCTAPATVSIKGHLVNEADSSEAIEITHTL